MSAQGWGEPECPRCYMRLGLFGRCWPCAVSASWWRFAVALLLACGAVAAGIGAIQALVGWAAT